MHSLKFVRVILKSLVVMALVVATLIGLAASMTKAGAAGSATYNVIVGTDTAYGIESLAFFPQTLKIHKGDTVTWQFRGFHNVRFDQKPLDLVIVDDVDSKQVPEFNPAVLLPNAKSGDPYKAGANSGVGIVVSPTAPTFSMVMNMDPGSYNYICDVHPGMMGTIVLVDDQTSIPAPADVDKSAQDDLNSAIAAADNGILAAIKKFVPDPKSTTLQVSAGLQVGTTAVTRFYPEDATISVGQSVTWTIPSGFDIHTVNFPLAKEGRQDMFNFTQDSKKALHALVTDAGNANVESGADLPADSVAKSGVLAPGKSFTLKFTKPGVYAYYCAIHPDQFGTIEVVAPPPTQ